MTCLQSPIIHCVREQRAATHEPAVYDVFFCWSELQPALAYSATMYAIPIAVTIAPERCIGVMGGK